MSKSAEKDKEKDKEQEKEGPNLIEEISKKIHKKILIKKARILIEIDTKLKKDRTRKNKSSDNFYKQQYHNLLDDLYFIGTDKNERKFTQNNYLEIETNSSEFSDIPSELDSEISEMIRIKKEKEKNSKETEEGIYATKTDTKKKGDDFIISRPIDKTLTEKKKQKEKEEEEKKKKAIKEEKSEDKDLANLNKFLNVNEKGELEEDKKKLKLEIKKEDEDFEQKEKQQTVGNLVQKYKDIKIKVADKNKNNDEIDNKYFKRDINKRRCNYFKSRN